MNRCPSEWYFQKFLEEAVLDSPDGAANPSPMAGASGPEAVEVKKPVAATAPAATSAVVDLVEYNTVLKQKLEKDLSALTMWRVNMEEVKRI